LGFGDWPKSPTPNPQSQIPNIIQLKFLNLVLLKN